MLLGGDLKKHPLLILFFVDGMMDLPINIEELEFILKTIKYKNPQLYNKLWSYKFNHLSNKQNNYGLS